MGDFEHVNMECPPSPPIASVLGMAPRRREPPAAAAALPREATRRAKGKGPKTAVPSAGVSAPVASDASAAPSALPPQAPAGDKTKGRNAKATHDNQTKNTRTHTNS